MLDGVLDVEVLPSIVDLRRIDPARNMRRFYRMVIQCDLFGRASLIRTWGRLGTRGQQLIMSFDNEGQAMLAMTKLLKEKQRRGYELCGAIAQKT